MYQHRTHHTPLNFESCTRCPQGSSLLYILSTLIIDVSPDENYRMPIGRSRRHVLVLYYAFSLWVFSPLYCRPTLHFPAGETCGRCRGPAINSMDVSTILTVTQSEFVITWFLHLLLRVVCLFLMITRSCSSSSLGQVSVACRLYIS